MSKTPSLPPLTEVAFADPLPPARAWHRANLADETAIRAQVPGGAPLRFNLLSLPCWLAVAERAGIAFIPAREIASLDVEAFTADPVEGHDPTAAFEAEIVQALGADELVRFEQVAPAEIKHEMSAGQPLGNGTFWSEPLGRQIVPVFEDRFYTTLLDLAPERIRAFARPKATTETIPGNFAGEAGAWPVEFRVFVVGGKITGISNYYPQIALDPSRWRVRARECLGQAQAMIKAMDRSHLGVGNHRLCPDAGDPERASDWMPDAWGPQDFTLDFLFDAAARRMVFLEGGPAGLQAAHPCCFPIAQGHPADLLAGAVFARGATPIPLSEL